MAENLITFHYLKASDYRSIHADGAFGGITPSGEIFCSFYIERPAIPQTIQQELGPDGVLGKEVARTQKHGVIREVPCGITMNLRTAEAVSAWLLSRIDEVKKGMSK